MLPSLLLPHLHQQTPSRMEAGGAVGAGDLPSLGTAGGVCPGSGELHTEMMELWNGLCWQRAQSPFHCPPARGRDTSRCPRGLRMCFPRGEHPGCSGKLGWFNPEGQHPRGRAGSGAAPARGSHPQSHGSPLRGLWGSLKSRAPGRGVAPFQNKPPHPPCPSTGTVPLGLGSLGGQREKGERSD